MTVKTPEQLEEIFLEVKPAFPEVNPKLIRDDSIAYDYSMVADVLESGNILWSDNIFYLSRGCVKGMLAHEYSHLINQIEMKDFSGRKKKKHRRYYDQNPIYKAQIERAADATAVRRGFAKEMIELIRFFRAEDPIHMRKYHLSLREIRELNKKRN